MKLIYILGPAHGRVEEFKPPLGAAWLPPNFTRQEMAAGNELGKLYVTYCVIDYDHKEAYYIPTNMGMGTAIKLLANMVGESNES